MIAAGQTIGNYRILNKIGTGGMGAVYLAEHPQIGKRVALKVIHRELASNREVVQRFFQEAKAVNKIGNEHIVEIHDFGVTPEGDHYYIMEYLEGNNLATVIHHEHLIDIVRALHIGAQVANALAAAHAAGIIHRDLKPDNVMLTTRLGDPDFVKLLDFGLAKMFSGGGPSVVKTAAGVLLGTPQYMSPEACESRQSIDHRTDIYALGILLFQMMTGRLPFEGETMGEVLVKQVTQLPPPPRAYNANVPPSVEQILLRCLAKQPDGRFPTMLALREALLDPDRYLMSMPPIAPARSLAPGETKVDAKTIMAFAQNPPNLGATRMGMGNELPLSPPVPSAAGQATMFAGAAPPPGAGGNVNAKTMFSPGGPPSPAHPMGYAATAAYAVQSGPGPGGPGAALGRKTIAIGPDLSVPMAGGLSTHTMQIATPYGYSARPPRRTWPIVLGVALVLGLGGGAIAVAYFKKAPVAVAGTGDGGVADAKSSTSGHTTIAMVPSKPVPPPPPAPPPPPVPIDAGVAMTVTPPAPPDAAMTVTPLPQTAMIEIDSVPAGAEIFGPGDHALGKTPAKLQLPIGADAVTYELRLPGYHKKSKQFVVTGDATFTVELDRVPAQTQPPHHPNQPHHCSDCLEPP